MMDFQTAQNSLNRLAKLMVGKGLKTPQAELALHDDAGPKIMLAWRKADAVRDWDKDYEWISGDSLASIPDMFRRAEAFITELPSADEKRRADFMAALGRLIDQGREAHIEVEFVNPLVVLMKSLSENIITDARGVRS